MRLLLPSFLGWLSLFLLFVYVTSNQGVHATPKKVVNYEPVFKRSATHTDSPEKPEAEGTDEQQPPAEQPPPDEQPPLAGRGDDPPPPATEQPPPPPPTTQPPPPPPITQPPPTEQPPPPPITQPPPTEQPPPPPPTSPPGPGGSNTTTPEPGPGGSNSTPPGPGEPPQPPTPPGPGEPPQPPGPGEPPQPPEPVEPPQPPGPGEPPQPPEPPGVCPAGLKRKSPGSPCDAGANELCGKDFLLKQKVARNDMREPGCREGECGLINGKMFCKPGPDDMSMLISPEGIKAVRQQSREYKQGRKKRSRKSKARKTRGRL